ncbi:hypothetical protein DL762_001473 [Monosporascus cannonballus]|uniref:Uncharacterized protein n=1 Tax=Monosporascus cannonballus TaxID=155416 RepID=A0ABY0HG89_9PEZI|nr:hypothetical protein DL762_001473 [Monosporascus cannonballus]
MLSLLPDLTPRDSHSLWYTSPRNPLASGGLHDGHGNAQNGHDNPSSGQQPPHHHHHHHGSNRRGIGGGGHLAVVERSPLARLRADELNLERRRHNVGNFGSGWLKPPGVPKTLHQLREERREAEEHQEAMRREQLAQELAAAAAAAAGPDGVDALLLDAQQRQQGEGGDGDGMDDVQLDGARDLDEDIPEGDADFGLGGSDEEEEEEDDDDDDDDEGDGDEEELDADRAAREQEQLMAQRMRSAQGGDAVYYGAEDEVDDEDQAHMIEEEDLVGHHGDAGDDMNMDADLDDDVPEAESAGYEHTDTEAELSSSDGDHAEMSFARAPQPARFRHSLARSDATRHSIAISDLLSRDGSSILDSSPQVARPSIGPSRRGRG